MIERDGMNQDHAIDVDAAPKPAPTIITRDRFRLAGAVTGRPCVAPQA